MMQFTLVEFPLEAAAKMELTFNMPLMDQKLGARVAQSFLGLSSLRVFV